MSNWAEASGTRAWDEQAMDKAKMGQRRVLSRLQQTALLARTTGVKRSGGLETRLPDLLWIQCWASLLGDSLMSGLLLCDTSNDFLVPGKGSSWRRLMWLSVDVPPPAPWTGTPLGRVSLGAPGETVLGKLGWILQAWCMCAVRT